MRYIFDISDTGGKNVKLTRDLEGENLKDYVDFLVSEGQIEQYDNSDRESLKNILKQFTGTDVWQIIKRIVDTHDLYRSLIGMDDFTVIDQFMHTIIN